MIHGKKFKHLGRTAPHRKAMLGNMACSLIKNKRINTTVAKAKALRVYVEPLMTKSKNDTTHNRRQVFSHLQDKEAVSELFRTVAPKIADRNGGYTRIINTGFRLGDGAEMAMIEMVDFNELYSTSDTKKTRRSRRGKKKADASTTAPADTATQVEEAPSDAEASTEETPEASEE